MLATAPRPLVAAFRRAFDGEPAWSAHAPGRLTLLGAHVDSHDGLVLPAAIDRGITFAARARQDERVRLLSVDLDATAELDLGDLPPPRAERADQHTEWFDLPAGVAWVCQQQGLQPGGLDVAFGGDLAIGAGLSSSAAVTVGLLSLWNGLGAWGREPAELVDWARRVENDYLDVQCGIMDQFACLHGRAGHAIFLDCRDRSHRWLPLPTGCSILIADSGRRRRLAESAFNERRSECARALAGLRRAGVELAALRDLGPQTLERFGDRLDPVARRRARHVVEECRRVELGASALEAGDAAAFGRLMSASHAGSRDLYEVSLPELDRLASALDAAEGCYGSHLTGAGFGGFVVALVEASSVASIGETVAADFESAFGRRPPIHECGAADGARVERQP